MYKHTDKHLHLEPGHLTGSTSLIPVISPVDLQESNWMIRCISTKIPVMNAVWGYFSNLLSLVSSLSQIILNLTPTKTGLLKLFTNFQYGTMKSDEPPLQDMKCLRKNHDKPWNSTIFFYSWSNKLSFMENKLRHYIPKTVHNLKSLSNIILKNNWKLH